MEKSPFSKSESILCFFIVLHMWTVGRQIPAVAAAAFVDLRDHTSYIVPYFDGYALYVRYAGPVGGRRGTTPSACRSL